MAKFCLLLKYLLYLKTFVGIIMEQLDLFHYYGLQNYIALLYFRMVFSIGICV